MHPRNKYKEEPDFKKLAILYPEFRKVAIMVSTFFFLLHIKGYYTIIEI